MAEQDCGVGECPQEAETTGANKPYVCNFWSQRQSTAIRFFGAPGTFLDVSRVIDEGNLKASEPPGGINEERNASQYTPGGFHHGRS